MLRRICSSSGPSSTSNISAIRSPGKVALFVRRKNVAASRSSTKYPSGDLASQVSRAQLVDRLVEALAREIRRQIVEFNHDADVTLEGP